MKGKIDRNQACGDGMPHSKSTRPDAPPAHVRVPVVEEQLKIAKHVRPVGRVVVTIKPGVRTKNIQMPVTRQEVDVERVPINRVVEKLFPQRQEGDTTIIPVFEEELVVTRQLVLKEEIRITRRQTTQEVRRRVDLRAEEVNVTRSAV